MAQTIKKVLYLTVRSIELHRIKYELILDRKRIKTEYIFNCGRPIQNHQSLFDQLSPGRSYKVNAVLVKDKQSEDKKWVWTWPKIQEVDLATVDPKSDPEFVKQIPYYYTPEGRESLAEMRQSAKEQAARDEFDRNFIGPRLPSDNNLLDLKDH